MQKRPTATSASGYDILTVPFHRRWLAACLLTALTCGIPSHVSAASLAEQMGRAMARMMDTFSEQATDRRNSSFDLQTGPQNWGQMAPGMGGIPWSSPWNQWSMPGQMPGQMPGATGMPNWGAQNWGMPSGPQPGSGGNLQALNGAWLSNQGVGLIIRGDRLRMFSETDQHRDMNLRYEDNHVWLFDRDSGTAKRYEFAHAQDRMALRDPDGNTLLFRRWQAPKRSRNR